MSLGLKTIVRQFVFTTESLFKTSGQLHEFLGLSQGLSHTYTPALGFVNEVMMVGDCYFEVGEPIWAKHRYHEILAARGDCAQMIVLQTGDADALRSRAQSMNLTLTKDKLFQEQTALQFDPQVFGTRFETYQYDRPDGWWSGPAELYTPSTKVKSVLGGEVAVEDPRQAARQLAEVYLADLGEDETTVRFADKTMKFIPTQEGWNGLVSLDFSPLDPSLSGSSETICGTRFRFM